MFGKTDRISICIFEKNTSEVVSYISTYLEVKKSDVVKKTVNLKIF